MAGDLLSSGQNPPPSAVFRVNERENKKATAISLEIRILKKKNKELLRKVPSKMYESNFIMERNKKRIWFVNISEYHHEMGLKANIAEKVFFLQTDSFTRKIYY